MNSNQFSAAWKAQIKTKKDGSYTLMSLPKLKELYALSLGYLMALDHMGKRGGDPTYNDAFICNMEIQRTMMEVYNYIPEAWWYKEIK